MDCFPGNNIWQSKRGHIASQYIIPSLFLSLEHIFIVHNDMEIHSI